VGAIADLDATEKRKVSFPLQKIEPQILGRPAHNLVTIHIELFRFRFKGKATHQKRTVEWR
jgi:hypothetical protein